MHRASTSDIVAGIALEFEMNASSAEGLVQRVVTGDLRADGRRRPPHRSRRSKRHAGRRSGLSQDGWNW